MSTYCTPSGFSAWLKARDLDTEGMPAEEVQRALDVAEEQVASITRRQLVPIEDFAHVQLGNGYRTIAIPDMLSVSRVEIDGVALDVTKYFALPLGQQPKYMVQARGAEAVWPVGAEIMVTGTRGYRDPLPPVFADAAYVLACGSLFGGVAGENSVTVQGITIKMDDPGSVVKSVADLLQQYTRTV